MYFLETCLPLQADITILDLAQNLQLELETHSILTEDGYILQVRSRI